MLKTAEFPCQVNWMHPYGNRHFRNRGAFLKALLKEINYLSEPPPLRFKNSSAKGDSI